MTKKQKRLLLLEIAVVVLAVIAIIGFKQFGCKASGGTWLKEYNECESPSSDTKRFEYGCKRLGGNYFDCESPCRHDPKTGMCITLCVKVCKF